jgi:hypothetical protein
MNQKNQKQQNPTVNKNRKTTALAVANSKETERTQTRNLLLTNSKSR